MPRAIAADLARPVISPDHAAVAMPVAVIVVGIALIARRVEPAVKVMPVIEMRPEIGVTVSVAHAAAEEHRRGAKAAAMKAAAPEPAAVERSTAVPENPAMEAPTMESADTASA